MTRGTHSTSRNTSTTLYAVLNESAFVAAKAQKASDLTLYRGTFPSGPLLISTRWPKFLSSEPNTDVYNLLNGYKTV
jgi:hypothetical protein